MTGYIDVISILNYMTHDSMKIKIASIHLEGRALQWHQNYLRCKVNGDVMLWK